MVVSVRSVTKGLCLKVLLGALVVGVMEPLGGTDFLKEVLRTGPGHLYHLPQSCSLSLLPVCGWKCDQLLRASAALCAFPPPVGAIPLEL